jgi:hypothetical protein
LPHRTPETARVFWFFFPKKNAAFFSSLALTVLSLALILRAIIFVCRHYIPEAYFDIWLWISDFQLWADRHYTLHDLIKPHYGQHRIATARLLLLLDAVFFNMTGLSVVLINLALLAATGLLLWRLAGADRVARTGWVLPPVFWVALMVSVAQVENLTFPFQVQFACLCLATCAAAALLTRASEMPGLRGQARAASAALCSIAAIFSMASGILAVPGMLALLLLRRARRAIWLAYAPLTALGFALFFHHYPPTPSLPLLDAHLARPRALFVLNFLGSAFTAFPRWAPIAGLGALVLFGAAALSLSRQAKRALPSGDAALVALGIGIALCGPAASLTTRIVWGPGAALVTRYATMSLLFAAVVCALILRWGARANGPAWARDIALPLAAAGFLIAVNAPAYDTIATNSTYNVLSDTQLLRNNVGIAGPAPVLFGGRMNEVRNQVAFLHARGMNIFAAGEGPPPALLSRLRHSNLAALPACRGAIDNIVPIDDTAFLLQLWLTGAQASHTMPWAAAIDSQGNLLGTSRALTLRPDVAAALHLARPAYGADAAFRLAPPARFAAAPISIRVVGLDPGAPDPLCALAQPALINPVQLTPLAALAGTTPRGDAPPRTTGFKAMRAPYTPFAGPTWSPTSPNQAGAALHFVTSPPPPPGKALAVPFVVPSGGTPGAITFLLADGMRVPAPTRWPWNGPAWRAAVLPPEIIAAHGGVVAVDIVAPAGAAMITGAPVDAALSPGWSRLF